MFTSFSSNFLTISQKPLWANCPCFGIVIQELPSDFQTFFSTFLLFPGLIWMSCNLISISIFDVTWKVTSY